MFLSRISTNILLLRLIRRSDEVEKTLVVFALALVNGALMIYIGLDSVTSLLSDKASPAPSVTCLISPSPVKYYHSVQYIKISTNLLS